MRLVKAREMERIDHFAIEPLEAEEIDRTLEEMWRSGRRSREGRLCVLRSADGVHVKDAVRRFAKRVCRRLPAAKIEDASLASIVQLASDTIYRPIVVVRTQARCTAKSVLRAAAKALGTLHDPRMSVAETCAMVKAAADHQQTRIIIFDNLPHNFGGEPLADALRQLRKGGSQIVCILRKTAGNQRG
jgi:hypothetical protein